MILFRFAQFNYYVLKHSLWLEKLNCRLEKIRKGTSPDINKSVYSLQMTGVHPKNKLGQHYERQEIARKVAHHLQVMDMIQYLRSPGTGILTNIFWCGILVSENH